MSPVVPVRRYIEMYICLECLACSGFLAFVARMNGRWEREKSSEATMAALAQEEASWESEARVCCQGARIREVLADSTRQSP